MGMQLPGWLREALEYVGYDWPATDESVLSEWAHEWDSLSRQSAALVSQLDQGIQLVTSENRGPAVNAFRTYASGEEGNRKALMDFSDGAAKVSGAHAVASGIVLTMKLAVIAQLVILAGAIATAVLSFGIGTGVAVAARQAAKWAINAAINVAIEQILAA